MSEILKSPYIVVDASPLISFLKINRVDLLNIYQSKLVCTDFVYDEVTQQPDGIQRLVLSGALEKIVVDDPKHLLEIEALYSKGLGRGEASSMILSKRLGCKFLVDDKGAKKRARKKGIAILSTAETIVSNIRKGSLTLHEADSFIQVWKSMGEFPVTVKSFRELLK